MAISDVSSKSFANELMNLSLSIIWKNQGRAIEGDADVRRSDAEAYIAARKGELNFTSVAQFHEEVLQGFFPDPDELTLVLMDKKMIPNELRPMIVKAEQDFIVDYWENKDGEINPYYRTLFGLPSLDTPPEEFVYNRSYADFPMDVPVHLLPYVDRLKLEKLGFFKELIENDTDGHLEYLNYIGKNRIYPYVARQAEPFEIISIGSTTLPKLRQDFADVYEQARRMVVRVYYSDSYRNKDNIYDRFLAMCILFITQQRMCSMYIDTNVTRDFYDLDSLRLVYAAYSFPFYANIPLVYHQKIVKRLNELLSYKGSTQVFYDLFNIFDFGKMDVFEYFLVKKRLVDSSGNPIFKDIYGRPLDDDDMWDIRFSRISWKDEKFVEVTNPENYVHYDELTVPDPYWVEDALVKEKLYGRDWNYFHSKYLGVEIMFDLNKLVFEICYFMRMLQDNRGTTQEISTYYPVTGTNIPLYDLVVYAIALLCKNAGYNGEIPAEPASIAAVYGFNFSEYNRLLKMSIEDMDTFVLNFKDVLRDFIADNAVLCLDSALKWWVEQITDGAFEYLGDDFEFTHITNPPPLFLKDFIPTNNSVRNLIEYLKQTIDLLKNTNEPVEAELKTLFQVMVTADDFTFEVKDMNEDGSMFVHKTFYFKKYDFTEEEQFQLRQAITLSYEHMLTWVLNLLKTRRALTFDPHILELIRDMDITELKDVCAVYDKLLELDDYLTYQLQRVHTKTEYDAYYNIRKILMTTRLMNETYAKRNGQVAGTFAELLSEINPLLYQRLTNDETDCENEEQYVIQTLMNLCAELKLLQAINTDNMQRVIEYLMKILRFLKSAKVDLVNFEIIYLISDRSANYLKLISEIWDTDVEDGHLKDKIDLLDKIHIAYILQIIQSEFVLVDPNLESFIVQELRDRLHLSDGHLDKMFEIDLHDSFQYWFDWISDIMVDRTLWDRLPLDEKTAMDIRQRLRTAYRLSDEVHPLIPEEEVNHLQSELLLDALRRDAFKNYMDGRDRLTYRDDFNVREILYDALKDKLPFRATLYSNDTTGYLKTLLEMDDFSKNYFQNRMVLLDRIALIEKGVHYVEVHHEAVNDAIMFKDRLIKASEEILG